ncbi:hypothetical protein ACIBHY_50095 [Nonomuraea sp. NPDC050547]|uniref:hypothetical protein n=1 Tax=Nonomuraea sp. NPDC050547 TaxID=3364368 RepID=UPI00378AFBA2
MKKMTLVSVVGALATTALLAVSTPAHADGPSPQAVAEQLRNTPRSSAQDVNVAAVGVSLEKYKWGLNDNWIRLRWSKPTSVGYHDYVALYDHNPQDGADAQNNYLTYQWAKNGSAYETNWRTSHRTEFYAAYVSWDYDRQKYVVLARSGPWSG